MCFWWTPAALIVYLYKEVTFGHFTVNETFVLLQDAKLSNQECRQTQAVTVKENFYF